MQKPLQLTKPSLSGTNRQVKITLNKGWHSIFCRETFQALKYSKVGVYGFFLDSWLWFSITDMCVYLLLSSGTPACWMENPLFFSSSTYVHTSQGRSIYVDTIKVISAHQSICHATWPSPVIADNRSNSQVNYLSL